jgi:hypothetical protein
LREHIHVNATLDALEYSLVTTIDDAWANENMGAWRANNNLWLIVTEVHPPDRGDFDLAHLQQHLGWPGGKSSRQN